jgi:hypothetical protein
MPRAILSKTGAEALPATHAGGNDFNKEDSECDFREY